MQKCTVSCGVYILDRSNLPDNSDNHCFSLLIIVLLFYNHRD